MNQSFFNGAIGAHQQQQHLNVQANNIANVNTYGFKHSYARFSQLMYQNLLATEADTIRSGVGTRMLMTATNSKNGPIADTGRKQDYAIFGSGFFALLDPATNEVTFTRNGAFILAEYEPPNAELDEEGNPIKSYYLSDGEGRMVLNNEGGIIEVTDPNAEYPVGVFDYVNYDGMLHVDSTRLLPVDKNGQLRLGEGIPHQGCLEMSNVDLATEISRVIEAQRVYSLNLKMIQATDEIETTINGLRS